MSDKFLFTGYVRDATLLYCTQVAHRWHTGGTQVAHRHTGTQVAQVVTQRDASRSGFTLLQPIRNATLLVLITQRNARSTVGN